ncbi:hypothetical protein [Caldifermentibacillus hisashii]|uniref:hypothetical protein n=1 Tax=Caldifermentibacillus hisashii TaxID=996558 RepID=UPI003D193E96
MATRFILVTILRWKTSFSGDETRSRHHYGRELPFFGNQNKKTQASKHSSSTCP